MKLDGQWSFFLMPFFEGEQKYTKSGEWQTGFKVMSCASPCFKDRMIWQPRVKFWTKLVQLQPFHVGHVWSSIESIFDSSVSLSTVLADHNVLLDTNGPTSGNTIRQHHLCNFERISHWGPQAEAEISSKWVSASCDVIPYDADNRYDIIDMILWIRSISFSTNMNSVETRKSYSVSVCCIHMRKTI